MENATDLAYLDALGRYALRYVKDGQTLGLGTGRAASAFIRALGKSGRKVRGIPTSDASAHLGREVGIEIIDDLAHVPRIDIDFDGADEVDPRLNLIKGNGGAMVREKIVAAFSRRTIFLVGEEKLVKRLGDHGNLPVEVVPFALPYCEREITRLGLKPKIRKNANGSFYISDNGNLVLNCGVRQIGNAARLERELVAIAGVVGTGLFLKMADLVLVASRLDGSVRALHPRRPRSKKSMR
ncbi:MAG: ribose-5-phosphate isomerase RpiA [Candidatus Binataceae bacterium]